MARIRSIHPGFFKDEDIVAVSMPARLLLLGLGVEADDKGIFDWKPITLKMNIFPADNIELEPLLDELVKAGKVLQFSTEGRSYGAISNFRKHQRPKFPNDVHPITDSIRIFVGLAPPIPEVTRDNVEQFPRIVEKSLLMEDGVGEGVGVGEEKNSHRAAPAAEEPDEVIAPEKQYFRDGRRLFGKQAGSILALGKNKLGLTRALALLVACEDKQDPKEFFMAGVNKRREEDPDDDDPRTATWN